jgi:hypothetical protein
VTVKQLKEKLSEMEEDLQVYIYSDVAEAGGSAVHVKLGEEGYNSFPYCRVDKPIPLPQRFVLIFGY